MSLVRFNMLQPRYCVNYNVGYIGFVSGSGPIAHGIAYFEGVHALTRLRVTHALVVTGENQCVEAVKGKGVEVNPLYDYFESSKENILFRKPAGYTEELGWRIADTASREIGRSYDDLLVAGLAINGSLLGRLMSKAFGHGVSLSINGLLASTDRWICSELAAYSLNAQHEYTGRGVLSRPAHTITPQALFEDRVIFE